MSCMFYKCPSLIEFKIPKLDTDNAIIMKGMLCEASDELIMKFDELNINVRKSAFHSLRVEEDFYF